MQINYTIRASPKELAKQQQNKHTKKKKKTIPQKELIT